MSNFDVNRKDNKYTSRSRYFLGFVVLCYLRVNNYLLFTIKCIIQTKRVSFEKTTTDC